jgi:CHAT domain-containing protein
MAHLSRNRFYWVAAVSCAAALALALVQGDWRASLDSARKAAQAGQLAAAERHYLDALTGAQKADAKEEEASIEYELGRLLAYRLQKHDAALPHIARALEMLQDTGNDFYVAALHLAEGDCNFALGNLTRAEEAFKAALSDAKGLPADPNPQTIFAPVQKGLGLVSLGRGEFDAALTFLRSAADTFERLGNEAGVAAALSDSGSVYQAFGLFEKAKQSHLDALARLEKLPNASPQRLANVLTGVGNACWGLGDYEKALDYLHRSLEAWGRAEGDNRANIANCQNSIGAVHWSKGDYDKALAAYETAREARETLPDRSRYADTLNNIGAVHYAKKEYNQALSYYQRAFAIRKSAGSYENIGEVHLAKGELDLAADNLTKALNEYDKVGVQVGQAADMAAYQQANQKEIYGLIADLEVRRGRPEQALQVLEQGKANALSKQIALNVNNWAQALTDTERADLGKATGEAADARARLNALKAKGGQGEEFEQRVKDAEAATASAERRLTLATEAAFKNPNLQRFRPEPPASALELEALAADHPDCFFVEFSTLKDKTLAFVLSETGIKAQVLGLGRQQLQARVRAYLAAIQSSETEESKLAKQLYADIIAPLSVRGSVKRLVIVCDGPLLDLPFGALLDDAGKRLAETFAISNAYSLSALTWKATPRRPKSPALVIAEPASGLTPLPHAREEGEAVAKAIPGATLATGEDASEGMVKKASPDCAILHFACHGLLNPRFGLRSALALGKESGDSGQDGLLEAGEISQLLLSAQIAVLSACDTGKGVESGGEGLLGLVWGFRAAGVPAVVASNWPLDDAAAKRMMVTFYAELLAGKRKDDALQVAMLREMKLGGPNGANRSATGSGGAGKRSNAYYWASFKLIGDAEPLKKLPVR